MGLKYKPFRKTKKIVFYISALAMFVVLCIPLIYWIAHPDLSQMQVSLKLWWIYPGVILAGVGFNWGYDKY